VKAIEMPYGYSKPRVFKAGTSWSVHFGGAQVLGFESQPEALRWLACWFGIKNALEQKE
jgi:hypothetical protein